MTTLTKNKDTSITLGITIPWSAMRTAYEEVVADMVANAEVDGFRKGKAPRAVVEKSLDPSKVYEEAVKRIIPKEYDNAVKEHSLHPIILPSIRLKNAKENEDWVIEATLCEKPVITLGNYRSAIADLKKSKTQKIWVPGEETKKEEQKPQGPTLSEILETLSKNVQTTIPDILVEQEVNRMLSELIDQTKKIGLTIDQYLASTNKTADSIRQEYINQSKSNLVIEFALEAIADKESISVDDAQINEVLQKAASKQERDALENQKYYLASVLRRQKTLDFLAAL